MKTSPLLVLLVVLLLAPALLLTTTRAFADGKADNKAECLEAASKGQSLRDAHQLVEARERFRVCARQQCPAMVQQDCGGWLGDVERDLPTVVVTAKDGQGADLGPVKVSVDGQPLLTNLDGQAVPVNPGQHVFHFEAADGTVLDQSVLVKSGEKNQPVAVVLGKPAAALKPSEQTTTGPQKEEPPPPAAQGRASPWKGVGWVLGGVGVAGLITGGVFGVVALGDKSAHCDAGNVCDPGSLQVIKNVALASDIGLIGGGVLLVGGGALVLLVPSRGPEQAAAIQIGPTWTANGGGVTMRGIW